MKSKWITVLMVLLMGYSLLTQKTKLITTSPSPSKIQIKEEKHEIINKIKAYVELITADPETHSLRNKDKPLINQDTESLDGASPQNTVGIDSEAIPISPPSSQPPSSLNPTKLTALKDSTDFGVIQNKIYNVLYNALQTKPGKELLERLLTTPREEVDTGNKPSEPNPYNNNSILDVIEGEGGAAECGDIATIHYTTRLVNGQEIENTRLNNKPSTFQIGDRKVIKGLEYAVIGMKKGGIRRLIIPPRLAYNKADFAKNLVSGNEFVTLDIELIDLKFAFEDWQKQITIFQKPDEDKGVRMLCSNEIYFTYKISTTHEQVLLSSAEPAHFILGSSQVPAAINKSFSGIKAHSKRIVMLPSSLIYNKQVSFFSGDIKLPAKEMLIFEIKAGGEIK